MPTNRDYYEILGINKKASDGDIKKAYRKLAREHHPDMVNESDKTAAEKRFKEINEAYQVLRDPQKKKMYDQFGHTGPGFSGASEGPFRGGFSGKAGWGPFTYSYTTSGEGINDFDPFDIFEDFFGFRGFSGRKRRQGKNLYYELHIDFKDAIFGVEKIVNVESGKVKIKIPAGVRNGTEIRFSGKGMPGPKDVPPGDLLLTLRLKLPGEFRRIGDTLGIVAEIDMAQAALGDIIEVPVVDLQNSTGLGKAKLKIPAGTQAGTQIRLKGKGLPRLNRDGRGDVIVQVMVKIPSKLSKKKKKLLEEYMKAK